MKPTVVVEKLNEEKIESQMYEAACLTGLADRISGSRAIFIKPNLTYPVYRKGVTTRFEFIRSLVAVLTGINPRLKIYIGEGNGGYNSYSMTDAFRDMGFLKIKDDFANVEVVNLSEMPSRIFIFQTLRGEYPVTLPELFFGEVDFSISCPVSKVHCMTKLTLSLKNQWGCLPDVMRLKNHYMFNHIIAQISHVLKFEFAFLDGKFGLNNNGPMVGDPVELDWFVASNSLGAFDAVVSDMMGFSWKTVQHLRMADKYGLMPDEKEITLIGDAGSLRKKFVLKRSLWNYPALAAFHSRRLTHLFYLSSWSKLLHDIMYLFRKRPISSEGDLQ